MKRPLYSRYTVYSMLAVITLERCSRLINMEEVVENEVSRVDMEKDVRKQLMQ